MNTIERNRLLMETEGFDCSAEARSLSAALAGSTIYSVSKDRLEKAAQTRRPSVMAAYVENRDLDFAINSMADYAMLEASVLRYAVKALPKWWVNPLDTNNLSGTGITSIGQLFACSDGSSLTIDMLCKDKGIPLARKEDIAAKRVSEWQADMVKKTSNIMAETRRGRLGMGIFSPESLAGFFRALLLFVANIYAFALLLVPAEAFRTLFYHPDGTEVVTYAIYVPLIVALIYDIVYCGYEIIKARTHREAEYAGKFAALQARSYMRFLYDNAAALLGDINAHIVAGTPLEQDSIGTYAGIYGQKFRIEEVDSERERNARKSYSALRSWLVPLSWLTAFAIVFSLITIAILGGRGLFA